MKQQIARFSPHQNGKVMAVLMAVFSLIVVVPITFLQYALMAPQADGLGLPVLLFLLFPILYLIIGYIGVVIFCALYNALFKLVGGIEVEWRGS